LKKWFSTFCFALVAGFASQAHAGKAINFNFTDSNGKTHQLSDYRGKWVLVNFWAPGCPRCKMEFSELNDLDARPDFVVIGVAMDYGIDEGSVRTTMQRYNLRFPQIIGGNRRDTNSPALQVGPVDYYPTSYLYAPDGEIVMFVPGIISKQKMIAFTEQNQKSYPTAFAKTEAPTPAVAKTEPPAAVAPPAANPGVQKASMSKTSTQSTPNKKKVTVY
jgi:thiol-disulfide isomerase/thioredoxin